ncbi:hypothetical protein VHEMI07792 [[Torrubiella] hemipterigena]|uniref:Uncharacterized protein n=1 Tax=[Torrubiella] hemipterigena TaxID=1531966 RepID=A0A0A1TNL2_9HYPO|nr:hypothetical protein VHEMI07792 [[Torrubiella] hemipterigena]
MNPIPMASGSATPLLAKRFSPTEYAALYMDDTSPRDTTGYSPPPTSLPSSVDPSSPQTPEFTMMTPQEEKPQLYWDTTSQTTAARHHQMEMTAAKLKALALAGQRRVSALEQENKHLKAALAGGIFRGCMQSYQKRFPQDQQQGPPDFSQMVLSVTVMVNNQSVDPTSGSGMAQDWQQQQQQGAMLTASHFKTTMSEIQQCMNPTDLEMIASMGATTQEQPSIPQDGYFSDDGGQQQQQATLQADFQL